MSFLSIENLQKDFGPVRVVKDFALDVARGEFVSFLGPSGCGKTTVLRMVAGFEEPTEGRITIGGKDVTRLKPNQRDIGMVFQAYALFPNMTVAQNIGFGLRVARRPRAEIAARVAEMLDLIKLPQFADRYPYQLSGGQQQRVALARALAPRPKLLLLDEPLSALDAKVRVSLRDEIRNIQRELGITTVFVTHDQEEALSMSDRIVVMNEGRADQVGTPFEIYNRPTTSFVATFVGTLSTLSGRVTDPTAGNIEIAGREIRLREPLGSRRSGDRVALALRPEAVSLGSDVGRNTTLEGQIREVHFLGSVIRIKVAVGDDLLSLDTFNKPSTPPPSVGDPATISFAADDLLVLQG